MDKPHRIHHWTLEIFAIGCGIHEAMTIYPDLQRIVQQIPNAEWMFSLLLKVLFIATLLAWLGVGVLKIWRYFFPQIGHEIESDDVSSGLFVPKAVSMKTSGELGEFFSKVQLYIADIDAAAQRYLNHLDTLRRLFEHDEREANLSMPMMNPDRISPALFRGEHDSIKREDQLLKVALTEMQAFLS